MRKLAHNASEPDIDTAALWQEALVDYMNETGTDLLRHDLTRLVRCETVGDVLADIEEEMDEFWAFQDPDNRGNWLDIRDFVKRIAGSVLVLNNAVSVVNLPDASIFNSLARLV